MGIIHKKINIITGGGIYKQPRLPSANMADADLDTKLYSLIKHLSSTHSRCYGFVYVGIACMLLLNTVIWITYREFCC